MLAGMRPPSTSAVGDRLLPRRLAQLYVGLALYGVSMALFVRARLGVMPWDVLHQGITRHVDWSLGTVSIVVGALVLLLWVPLRQRPGVGTVSNVVVIGLSVDAALAVLPAVQSPAARVLLVVGGIVLNAVATAAYIGVHLGPGPRDGLMTGLVRRTGWSVRLVRTGIEVAVVCERVAARRHLGSGYRPLRPLDRPARPGDAAATVSADARNSRAGRTCRRSHAAPGATQQTSPTLGPPPSERRHLEVRFDPQRVVADQVVADRVVADRVVVGGSGDEPRGVVVLGVRAGRFGIEVRSPRGRGRRAAGSCVRWGR